MNIDIFKIHLKEFLNKRKFYFPGKMKEYKRHGLLETQVYQMGKNFDKAMKIAISNSLSNLKFKKKYKIASIGTCFAEEISKFLKNEEDLGTYIQLEKNFWDSSVDWGRVYTIKNIKQIIEYSINTSMPIYIEKDKNDFFDPLREKTVKRFKNKKDLYKNILSHRSLSREILNQVDVLVITIGQNEFWKDIENNTYWGIMPPLSIINKNKSRFILEESTVENNLKDLKWIVDSISKINKSIQFLFTVSPVPSDATFLSNDVISQSFAGKCILRSTLHELLKEKKQNVFYFPSFVIALAKNKETFKEDNRHVKISKVKEILSYLKK